MQLQWKAIWSYSPGKNIEMCEAIFPSFEGIPATGRKGNANGRILNIFDAIPQQITTQNAGLIHHVLKKENLRRKDR